MSEINDENAIIKDDKVYGKKIKSIPKPEESIGIDTNDSLLNNIAGAAINSQIDLSTFNKFNQVSQRRDQLYNLIDSMSQDPIISAVLETYAEDATEYNDEGKIIWSESDVPEIAELTNFILTSMQVDKHAYSWVHSLCKYGDLYLQLFKQSEYDNDDVFSTLNKAKENKQLNEDIKVHAYKDSDKFVYYVEAEQNPAPMFELTRFGKTQGFIKADVTSAILKNNFDTFNNVFTYKYKTGDINIYGSDKFVHAVLDDESRATEEVQLFLDNKSNFKNSGKSIVYKVKRGQSLLYNTFKIWRELSLLENSILLNRVTKSAIVRLINVEVGDMPKEMVGPHLQGIKSMMEQKAAIDTDNYMTEYTNPGPIENNIYVPTRDGKGTITADQIGGDVNVGSLPDIEYFQNKMFGSLRVPKQYFGLTEDSAGFNGGESLAIISSRYAKAIKNIQNSLIQAITAIVNIMLVDKGLSSYINKFTIKMQPPTTKEEIDRRENLSAKVAIIRDLMDLVEDIQDPATKLKILKSLLSNTITNTDVISLIDDQINEISEDEEVISDNKIDDLGTSDNSERGFNDSTPLDLDSSVDLELPNMENISDADEENTLPTPEELDAGDLTDNTLD